MNQLLYKYFILEEDGRKARMEMRKVNPDVYSGSGFSPKTRCVTKKLPEEAMNDCEEIFNRSE